MVKCELSTQAPASYGGVFRQWFIHVAQWLQEEYVQARSWRVESKAKRGTGKAQ